jgi:peptidoglycan/xylan/chitin deacetylase (PgdA/CDA1 family)
MNVPPPMLRSSKLAFLHAARSAGLDALLLRSAWRRKRLLILCYHGVSLDDEHRWSGLYVSPEHFRRRLEILERERCAVLPLDSAVRALREGTLPERAVTITFDDGFHDFYAAAWPALREFGFPATVYLTTYYCFRNSPVFDPMCSYLLWKGRGRVLAFPEVLPEGVTVEDGTLRRIRDAIFRYCRERDLSADAKDALLRDLATKLGCDLDDLCRRRILHLMTPEECAEAAAGGVDLQLHTHRHRVSREREIFWKEIDDNRAALAKVLGREAVHFCYPCGFTLPEFPSWLAGRSVVSATTCNVGLAGPGDNALLLPRLLDLPHITDAEFRAWISGLAALLPRRSTGVNTRPLLEEEGV